MIVRKNREEKGCKWWFRTLIHHLLLPINSLSFVQRLKGKIKLKFTKVPPDPQVTHDKERQKVQDPQIPFNPEWMKFCGLENDDRLAFQVVMAACQPKCYQGYRNVVDLFTLREYLKNPSVAVKDDNEFMAYLHRYTELELAEHEAVVARTLNPFIR